MYVRGGPVPDEPRYIAGVCNCSVRKWNAIRERLISLGKIHVVDGYLTNDRAEKEIENAAKDTQERAENGSKGGKKTAENRANINKNNGRSPASVQPTRATQYQHQIKKEGFLNFEGGVNADGSVTGGGSEPDILVLRQDHPDYRLALSIVGQSRVGKTGNITIKAADLERARNAA
jgi:uncharacterized protein YdaU (DUF1376 family)